MSDRLGAMELAPLPAAIHENQHAGHAIRRAVLTLSTGADELAIGIEPGHIAHRRDAAVPPGPGVAVRLAADRLEEFRQLDRALDDLPGLRPDEDGIGGGIELMKRRHILGADQTGQPIERRQHMLAHMIVMQMTLRWHPLSPSC